MIHYCTRWEKSQLYFWRRLVRQEAGDAPVPNFRAYLANQTTPQGGQEEARPGGPADGLHPRQGGRVPSEAASIEQGASIWTDEVCLISACRLGVYARAYLVLVC